jgi:uncharacterized protein (TIGR00730 family)
MGVLADSVAASGGEAIGVIPEHLARRDVAHDGVRDMRVVGSMHERKALMGRLSDAFIAMPGGFGTLDELCEVLTWAQLGLHRKPCGVLNVGGFFDPFLGFIDRCVEQGFILPAHRDLVLESSDPEDLIGSLSRFKPVTADKLGKVR